MKTLHHHMRETGSGNRFNRSARQPSLSSSIQLKQIRAFVAVHRRRAIDTASWTYSWQYKRNVRKVRDDRKQRVRILKYFTHNYVQTCVNIVELHVVKFSITLPVTATHTFQPATYLLRTFDLSIFWERKGFEKSQILVDLIRGQLIWKRHNIAL